jgi:hypothetical protein
MVDNMNPTSQFHPYTPETSTPAVERLSLRTGVVSNLLEMVGVDPNRLPDGLKNLSVSRWLNKARGYARRHPARVLGGLAVVAIGAGLMRRRVA